MKKKKIVLKSFLALLISFMLSMSFIYNKNDVKAEEHESTYLDYQGKTLFVPRECMTLLNFYVPTDSTYSGGENLGVIWIYQHYPYTPNINQINVYARKMSTIDQNLNGLMYRGSGALNYIVYNNGNYSSNSWNDNPNYPTLYIVIKFAGMISGGPYIKYPSVKTLLANGCQFIDGSPVVNSNLYYAFLGGYWSTKDANINYEKGINAVISAPNDYGLYNGQELTQEYNRGYTDGISESGYSQSWFLGIFTAISSVFSIKLFGDVTLGMIALIPFALSFVWFIIKTFRGGS